MKMIQPHIQCSALSFSLLASAFGGEYTLPDLSAESAAIEPSNGPDAFQWLTPSVDLLLRHEFRDQDGFDSSNALTARARLGLTLGEFHGFSAFGEIEATRALVRDFDVNGTSTSPNNPGDTIIADPDNEEFNRFWLQYKKDGILAKIGRQRIIRNNAAFIGNVGWRQNEQTFDAAQIGFTRDNFSLSYVYSDRVQRIFGRDAGGALERFEGDFHFIDGSYQADFGKVGGYVYLVDVENNGNVGESNTYGGFIDAGPVYAEFAYQDGTSNAAGGDYDAVYAHVKYTHKFGKTALTAGVEYLEDDFKTPLATVHAFNGYADRFIGTRIGLNSAGDGLSDVYLRVAQPLGNGFTFKGALHYFADDSFSETYGYEVDAVLVKKFSENITGLIKAAYYFGEDGSAFDGDIKQISTQIGYKF